MKKVERGLRKGGRDVSTGELGARLLESTLYYVQFTLPSTKVYTSITHSINQMQSDC